MIRTTGFWVTVQVSKESDGVTGYRATGGHDSTMFPTDEAQEGRPLKQQLPYFTGTQAALADFQRENARVLCCSPQW